MTALILKGRFRGKFRNAFSGLGVAALISAALAGSGCGDLRLGVYEQHITLPEHRWPSAEQPEFPVEISDTASSYMIFVVLRHTHAYRYQNLWINLHLTGPDDSTHTQRLDLRLASDEKGWLGTGMSDIYDHRITVTQQGPVKFQRPGLYRFRLEHLMREDPLEYVMNVGIRLEKAEE